MAKFYSDLGSLLKPTTETINIDSLNLENGTYVIGTGMSGTKPFEYGILIQFKRYTYTVQIAIDIDSAAIAKRQTNNERWPNWDFYVTKSDLTISDAKMAVERNSKGVYLMLRNKITNNRLFLLLDEGTKKLVLDSEISGEWTGADPIITKSDLDLQTQKLHKNVVIYRIGNIAMLSISSWVRKEELAGVTIPTGYRPVKNISIPFTQQNFNDGSYCDVTMEGKINYTGTSPILVNAVWFCA